MWLHRLGWEDEAWPTECPFNFKTQLAESFSRRILQDSRESHSQIALFCAQKARFDSPIPAPDPLEIDNSSWLQKDLHRPIEKPASARGTTAASVAAEFLFFRWLALAGFLWPFILVQRCHFSFGALFRHLRRRYAHKSKWQESAQKHGGSSSALVDLLSQGAMLVEYPYICLILVVLVPEGSTSGKLSSSLGHMTHKFRIPCTRNGSWPDKTISPFPFRSARRPVPLPGVRFPVPPLSPELFPSFQGRERGQSTLSRGLVGQVSPNDGLNTSV